MKKLYGYKTVWAAKRSELKSCDCEIVILSERKSEYSRDLLRIKWMKTLLLTVSSFASTSLSYCFALLSVFLYSKPFRNN